ncbi:hypothetical protein M2360_000910 [Rhizobium sp. SG_E_25_P2]|uniref:hypothetical protein n=1 Tax=Rhizobium sp. SG_E_25_P2 TaxID=2879942 RepID=UPI002475E824|nr:hypothetical protein [Rhizobium sp. SG_E_25_P2]MDH6265520.1 hypothetical protein [Rhizobium sp. SG_E_25_P2]
MNALTPLDSSGTITLVDMDSSGIVALIDRARSLFDEGDVMNARLMAGAAYDQAAQAVKLAEKVQASERLLEKSRRMHADALIIESQCKIRIAELWNAAKAEGKVSPGGRPKAGKQRLPTAVDFGATRKELHEFNIIRSAEERSPGLISRLVSERLKMRLAPSRADIVRAAKSCASQAKNNPFTGLKLRSGERIAELSWREIERVLKDHEEDIKLLRRVMAIGVPASEEVKVREIISADKLREIVGEVRR